MWFGLIDFKGTVGPGGLSSAAILVQSGMSVCVSLSLLTAAVEPVLFSNVFIYYVYLYVVCRITQNH